ncbi:MAG: hypothetical protein EXX96DRAFT_571497 [Benjaminiella poitrasii]|nr:MAG: hypothetical protein EXX96DRAFT_571497 [Benjaminiella poitrasii]
MSISPSKYPSTISERRSQYPLHERLIVYNSESMQRMIDNKSNNPIPVSHPTTSTFVVNGVNILNKNSLDSETLMHRILQRRQTHNRVERRRRDRMNNLFNNLAKCLPNLQHKADNNRADILQEAIDYIKQVQNEKHRLKYGTELGSPSLDLPSLDEDDLSSVTSNTTNSSSSSGSADNCIMPSSSSPSLLYNNATIYAPSSNNTFISQSSIKHDDDKQKQSCSKKPSTTLPQSCFESILTFP